MNVLSIYDYTGIMVEPWKEAGHNVLTVDIKDNCLDILIVFCSIKHFLKFSRRTKVVIKHTDWSVCDYSGDIDAGDFVSCVLRLQHLLIHRRVDRAL